MKSAAFTWATPADLSAASRALKSDAELRIIAGGQSLGAMLNLRVARPRGLLTISHLTALRGVADTASHVIIGACVTHAEIADGLAPDIGQQILPRIAQHIAYRAVRNRGTLGGSLCHADPAADWVCTLIALGADVILYRDDALPARAMTLQDFITGAFRTALLPGEILRAVRIPRLSSQARWGYFKACRKPGEFAHAMAAVLDDAPHRIHRAVLGAMGGRPLVLEGESLASPRAAPYLAAHAGGLDTIDRHRQMIALQRACAEAGL
jgi:carbon-monoxide dehydrogenase medium subunit